MDDWFCFGLARGGWFSLVLLSIAIVSHLFVSTLRFHTTCGYFVFFSFGWLVVSTLNWLVLDGFVKYHIQLLHWKFTALVGFG